MFEEKSRYVKLKPYTVTDRRRRVTLVVPVSTAPEQQPLGRHLLKQGQRLDHLSHHYLDDPAGYWRICEINEVMLPEELSSRKEIIIPIKEGLE
jgi:hypothetical protein